MTRQARPIDPRVPPPAGLAVKPRCDATRYATRYARRWITVVSSKLARLEDPEEVAARVEQAAAYHPRERLALSTQCGFATELEGNQLSEADQRAKLRLVADLAHRLWPVDFKRT